MSTSAVIRTVQGVSIKTRLQNVSASGALLQCSVQLPLYAQVRVLFPAGTGPPGGILAQVVRQDLDGLGVEWLEFTPGIVEQLLSLPAARLKRRSASPSKVS